MHKLVSILLILLLMSCWRRMQNQIVPRVLRLSRVHINPLTEIWSECAGRVLICPDSG